MARLVFDYLCVAIIWMPCAAFELRKFVTRVLTCFGDPLAVPLLR